MLLKNKKILISGLANKYSIAAGIAYAMHREGAELAFTYQNDRLLKNLKPIINGDSDLKIAMKMIAQTQKGPDEQIPSMGCNIKWFN